MKNKSTMEMIIDTKYENENEKYHSYDENGKKK